ncbi:hypothetical protein AcV5_002985 [Taiwanofungus camphoratus]|nr:hypothetical protein AcV5_002985 [Antrodia cinnamomea]
MSTKLKYPRVLGYRLVKEIGGGGFATVFRAVHLEDHRVAACKLIALTPETTEKDRKTLNKEIRIHSALKHPYILDFIGAVIVEPDTSTVWYPGAYMLLELAAGGDLFDKIAPDVGVSEEVAHYYFCQLMAGLIFIHEQGVCHRDLKPENLLLDSAGTLKISDFGLCSVYKLKESGKTRYLTERCGSLPYIAPELCATRPYAAEPIDVWGSGVILFTMLCGTTPWDEPTQHSTEFARYLTGECFNFEPWSRFSENVLSLITGMLAVRASERMTLAEIVEHPWMVRPSQIANKGLSVLAERLTESLRMTGDLAIATPDVTNIAYNVDADGDQIMGDATSHNSQFTQTLLLFSQTQSGRRYTPHLTRFYSSLGPYMLMSLIQESLTELGVKWKPPMEVDEGEGTEKFFRMRIGGHDKRRVMFKGWVVLEHFSYAEHKGSFCVMQRDRGNPISWRQLWKAMIMSSIVEPHVLRRR